MSSTKIPRFNFRCRCALNDDGDKDLYIICDDLFIHKIKLSKFERMHLYYNYHRHLDDFMIEMAIREKGYNYDHSYVLWRGYGRNKVPCIPESIKEDFSTLIMKVLARITNTGKSSLKNTIIDFCQNNELDMGALPKLLLTKHN